MISKKMLLVFCLLLVFTINYSFSGCMVNTKSSVLADADILIGITGGRDLNSKPAVRAIFTNHPGFPIIYDKWTQRASVTIADINNDGSSELLLPTYDGFIYAWSATGLLVSGYPLSNEGWHIRGRLTLGDLNNDGNLEIAAGLESPTLGVGPRISIWKPNGQLLSGWPKNTVCSKNDQDCGVSAIIMADLDKDSNLEVIAATDNRDLTSSDSSRVVPGLYVWKNNGDIAPGAWPNEDDHNVAIIGQLAVGDLDGDTYPDLVVGRDYNRLFAFNRYGANLSGWPHYVWYPYDDNDWTDDQIEFPRSLPALADLDQDGDLEFIIPGHRRHVNLTSYLNTDLLIYNKNATRFTGWELPASGSNLIGTNSTRMLEEPAIADLNNDNHPEIILTGQDGHVRVYTSERQLLWSFNYARGNDIHASETVIGDVDGDGWHEVVFGTFHIDLVTKGQVGVYILDHNGNQKSGSPILLDTVGISNSPALGDLDGDGLVEIAAATYDGTVYVWDALGSSDASHLPWPMPRHDLQRTGLYQEILPDFSQSSKFVSTQNASFGEIVMYTINLVSSGATLGETFSLADIVPTGLDYISGSLDASSGDVDENLAPLLKWTGNITTPESIVIWYKARVNLVGPGSITNTAIIKSESLEFTLNSTLIVNGKSIFFPIVRN